MSKHYTFIQLYKINKLIILYYYYFFTINHYIMFKQITANFQLVIGTYM